MSKWNQTVLTFRFLFLVSNGFFLFLYLFKFFYLTKDKGHFFFKCAAFSSLTLQRITLLDSVHFISLDIKKCLPSCTLYTTDLSYNKSKSLWHTKLISLTFVNCNACIIIIYFKVQINLSMPPLCSKSFFFNTTKIEDTSAKYFFSK